MTSLCGRNSRRVKGAKNLVYRGSHILETLQCCEQRIHVLRVYDVLGHTAKTMRFSEFHGLDVEMTSRPGTFWPIPIGRLNGLDLQLHGS